MHGSLLANGVPPRTHHHLTHCDAVDPIHTGFVASFASFEYRVTVDGTTCDVVRAATVTALNPDLLRVIRTAPVSLATATALNNGNRTVANTTLGSTDSFNLLVTRVAAGGVSITVNEGAVSTVVPAVATAVVRAEESAGGPPASSGGGDSDDDDKKLGGLGVCCCWMCPSHCISLCRIILACSSPHPPKSSQPRHILILPTMTSLFPQQSGGCGSSLVAPS